MLKKKIPQGLDLFVKDKKANNDVELQIYVDEVKAHYGSVPLFNAYVEDRKKKRKVAFYQHEVTGYGLDMIVDFIFDMRNEGFNVKYEVKTLMPQYQNMISQDIDKSLMKKSCLIEINDVIKDVDENKIGELSVDQQIKLFIDLSCSGNAGALKKVIDFGVLSPNGKAHPTSGENSFSRSDIVFALERAASYGHLDVVKEILENNNTAKIVDLYNPENHIRDVIIWGAIKDRKEIISFILDEKQYKLTEHEFNDVCKDLLKLGLTDIDQYKRKYDSQKIKPGM